MFLILQRYKACPLPGLEKSKSIMIKGLPSICSLSPLRKSEAVYITFLRAFRPGRLFVEGELPFPQINRAKELHRQDILRLNYTFLRAGFATVIAQFIASPDMPTL